jgi:hypothetical protein
VASVAAGIVIVTQLWLVASGNFAWLNWLTILLAVPAVDGTAAASALGLPRPAAVPGAPAWFEGVTLAAAAFVVVLSYWPARNLLTRGQMMNYSFNRWHLVNAYGAFGSISRVRDEVVVEGTEEDEPDERTVWKEYGFKGKPGEPGRLPRQWAPYHLRLDWLMWFAALSPAYARSWFLPFVARLLANDRATLKLLRHNPFPDAPPARVRATLYRYRFSDWSRLRATGEWWSRSPVREFLPPVSLREVRDLPR